MPPETPKHIKKAAKSPVFMKIGPPFMVLSGLAGCCLPFPDQKSHVLGVSVQNRPCQAK
jgi:hypothetical protein